MVINKTDLAHYVHASLEVMDRDSRLMRPGKPFVFTNAMTGEGVDELVSLIFKMVLFDKDGSIKDNTAPPCRFKQSCQR